MKAAPLLLALVACSLVAAASPKPVLKPTRYAYSFVSELTGKCYFYSKDGPGVVCAYSHKYELAICRDSNFKITTIVWYERDFFFVPKEHFKEGLQDNSLKSVSIIPGKSEIHVIRQRQTHYDSSFWSDEDYLKIVNDFIELANIDLTQPPRFVRYRECTPECTLGDCLNPFLRSLTMPYEADHGQSFKANLRAPKPDFIK